MFGWVQMNLSDVANIQRGVRVVRAQLSETNGYPVYQNSLTAMGYYEKNNCNGNTTFVIAAGAAGEVGFSDEKFWAADDCYYFDCSTLLNQRYLYHYLLMKQTYLFSQVRKASIPRISRNVIERMPIELPPMDEQEKIVGILDRFYSLCNDMIEGIPAEIEARQKQYEFYRDRLLTFEEQSL